MSTDRALLDIEELSTFLTPDELAGLMRTTTGALAQDRYLGRGIPFIKNGKRILYARADVADFIARNRRGGQGMSEPCSAVVERQERRSLRRTNSDRVTTTRVHARSEADGAVHSGGAR